MDSPYTHRCAICGARHTYRTVIGFCLSCGVDGRFIRPIGEKVPVLTETAVIDPPEPDLNALL